MYGCNANYCNKGRNAYDLVACDTIAVYPKKEIVIHSNISNNQSVNKLMIDAYAVIWNKIYKRELLEGLTFNTKMSFCEDVLFLYRRMRFGLFRQHQL